MIDRGLSVGAGSVIGVTGVHTLCAAGGAMGLGAGAMGGTAPGLDVLARVGGDRLGAIESLLTIGGGGSEGAACAPAANLRPLKATVELLFRDRPVYT